LGVESFYYSARRSVIFALRSPGQGQWGCTYYRVGVDGIRELRDEKLPWKPLDDEAKMRAWRKSGHPRTYRIALRDLRTLASPEWRDWTTGVVVREVRPLTGIVTESGACSTERYLGNPRDAGCLP